MFAASPLPKGARYAFVGLVFLILSADLKVVIHPQVHWVIALPLVGWALFSLRSGAPTSSIYRITLAGAALLCASIALLGATAAEPAYAFVQGGKLAIILGVVFPFLARRPDLVRLSYQGFGVTIVVNAALVTLGLLGLEQLAVVYAAEGRWGTLLNLPGSLSRLGLLLLVFSIYLLAHLRHLTIAIAVYIASCLLVMVDGSRTSIVLLLLGHFACLAVVAVEKRGKALVFLPLLAIVVWLAFTAAVTFSQDDLLPSALQRLATAIEDDEASLAMVDPLRQYMNEQALRQAMQSPLVGSGLNTLLTPVQGLMSTVHNTYLQLWAEVSIIAAAAFAVVALAWLPWAWRTLKAIATLDSPLERAIGYNAMFIALCFPLAAFFHPLSTEWTEWLPLAIAYAIIHQLQLRARTQVAAAAAAPVYEPPIPRAALAMAGEGMVLRTAEIRGGDELRDQLAELIDHSYGGRSPTSSEPERDLAWTVVIATHNRPTFLRRALLSVQAAAATPPTVIVVDDASAGEDNLAVCADFPTVTYLRNDERSGPGFSRNRGIALARTDLALVLDDDDELLPGALDEAGRCVGSLYDWRRYPVFQFAHGTGTLDENYMVFALETYFMPVYGGDFIPCFNLHHRDAAKVRYPHLKIGAEHLLWWDVAHRWGIPTWGTRIGVVNHDAPDRQTSAEVQLRLARLHAASVRTTLARFGTRLRTRSPHAYGARHVVAAMYSVLADDRRAARAIARRMWRQGRRGSALKAAMMLAIPPQALRFLLTWYRQATR